MAVVWLARDVRHERTIALKVLRPEFALSGLAARFLKETRVLAELQHPHILPLLDSGTVPVVPGGEATCPFFVMPWIRGESLRERLNREGPLPFDAALLIVGQVAGALDYAHTRGVVHRDVKPENILLDGDNAYLADFGIASALQEAGGSRLTETGLTLGTAAYMSPEQSAAERHIDGRSDEYSLACVVYELLAGEPPFTGATAQAIMAKRFAGPPPSINILRPSLPPQVAPALARALAQAPADRYPDTGAFAAALRAGPTAAMASTPRRSSAVRWIIFAAAVLVLLLAATYVRRSPAPIATPRPATRDALAIELVQRGDRAFAQRTQGGVADAVGLYSQAIARDSGYAPAWNGLAQAYMRAYIWAFSIPGTPRDSLLARALRATDGAFVADSSLARTWVTRSVVMRQLTPTSRTDALRAVRRALQLDQTNPEAWNEYAFSLDETDSLAAGLVARRRAVALRPTYLEAVQFLALDHMWNGSYDSAAVWADSSIALNPTYITGRHAAGWAALALHDPVRAAREFSAAASLGSGGTERVNSLAGLAMARAAGGDRRGARQIVLTVDSLARLEQHPTVHSVVFLAEAWGALGENDRAFAWLDRFAEPRDLHFLLHLRHDPAMGVLRSDPRYTTLLSSSK